MQKFFRRIIGSSALNQRFSTDCNKDLFSCYARIMISVEQQYYYCFLGFQMLHGTSNRKENTYTRYDQVKRLKTPALNNLSRPCLIYSIIACCSVNLLVFQFFPFFGPIDEVRSFVCCCCCCCCCYRVLKKAHLNKMTIKCLSSNVFI